MYVRCTAIIHAPLMLAALHTLLFFPSVGSFPSPASSPPPYLHRHIFKIFGTLRGECNTIQRLAEHLPALPSNTSDISVLPAQDQFVCVCALHEYCTHPTDAHSPTHSPSDACMVSSISCSV